MKPRKGQEIRYTEIGARNEGRRPGDVLGTVIGHSSDGSDICIYRTPEGNTSYLIWRFHDGLNTHFEWDGKTGKVES